MEMVDGYPYLFVMNDCHGEGMLEKTMQYRFKSTKSHHTYIVRIECYPRHTYCVKFYDKANTDSKNKFSLRTNTFEVRTVMYTLYHIMLEVWQKDEQASFFFIGAEDEKDELGKSTRRYRFYRKFVSSTISDRFFEHYRVNDLSLYILVNKESVGSPDEYVDGIMEQVRAAYGL